MSFLPLDLISGGTVEQTVTNPAATITSTAEGKSSWFSGGPVVEVRVADRYTVVSGFLLRGARYRVENAVTFTDTTATDRTTEESKVRYWDVPLMVRRYNVKTDDTRLRWFYEGGATIRTASGVRTSIQTEDNDGTVTCCEETPIQLSHRTVTGVTAGAGLRLIDDFGFQVVPEVRYTRWLGSNVSSLAARSNRNQVEIGISITF